MGVLYAVLAGTLTVAKSEAGTIPIAGTVRGARGGVLSVQGDPPAEPFRMLPHQFLHARLLWVLG